MGDSEKNLTAKMQEGATKVVVGGVAMTLALLVTGGSQAEAAFLAGALVPALESFVKAVRDRRVNRSAIWWEEVLRDPERGQEQVAAELLDATSNPEAVDVVMRSVRDLMEVVDEVVIPSLGVLAREYLREKKRVDPFYRSTVRVLCDCTSEDFTDLKALLQAASTAVDLHAGRSVLVDQDGGVVTFRAAGLPIPTRQLDGDARRVLHLLTVNSLASSEFAAPAYDAEDASPATRIDFAVLKQLVRILGVSDSSPS